MTELLFPSGLSQGSVGLGLKAIVDSLGACEALRFRDVPIDGIACHTKEVRRGSLFVAVRGTKEDGSAFAQQAVAMGAVAILSEVPLDLPVPVIVVPAARRALADAARRFYRDPSHAIPVVGITGTNGKTTTVQLVRACLEAAGKQVGTLGTIASEYAGRRLKADNTTPDPIRIHGYLREMVDLGVQACAMEVSSHALAQERVRGVRFAAGVFLNLTQDHLDYHGSMPEYAKAKARLFEMLEPGAHAIVCKDARAHELMAQSARHGVKVLTFGRSKEAMVRAEKVVCSLEGTSFDLIMPRGRVSVMLRLPGLHNVQNALAAATTALALGVTELTIAQALDIAKPVRGRLELVGNRGGVRVFVDYAHTPDALEKVCATLRSMTPGRLIVVFGCGGDRDKGKRPLMTRVVARTADLAVLTSDNPRTEDPEAILDQMGEGLRGLAATPSAECWRISDRATAIQEAIATAKCGDTVLVAGKGHETVQMLADTVVPFDDAEIAAEALRARGSGERAGREWVGHPSSGPARPGIGNGASVRQTFPGQALLGGESLQ